MATVIGAVRRAVGFETAEALRREVEEGRAKVAEHQRAAERAEQGRLEAEGYAAAEESGRRAAEHRWHAERIQARLPELERRLAEVTAREQRDAIARARTRWQALYRKLRDAVEAAAAVQAEVMEADAELIRELGENVVRTNLPPLAYRGLILDDLVKIWRAEMDLVVFGPPPADPPPPRVRRTPPSKSSVPHAVKLEREQPVPKAPKHPDDTSALQHDECRVSVLRSGFEAPDGTQCHSGRLIRLPREVAESAARNGAVTITERGFAAERGQNG